MSKNYKLGKSSVIRGFVARRNWWLAVATVLLLGQFAFGAEPPAISGGSDPDLFIVILRQPSVVEQILESTQDRQFPRGVDLQDHPFLQTFEARTESSQEEFLQRYVGGTSARSSKPSGVELVEKRTFLLNALFIRTSSEQLEALEKDPSVRGVYRSQERYPLMDTVPEVVNAPHLWAELGGKENAGAGTKIGIIDSGISLDHPMFSGTGMKMPAGFPKAGQNLKYINNKVIVARSYHQFFQNHQENKTPQDELGHGSRVAGVAAGRPVASPIGEVRGIAPAAFLGSYKVFGNPSLNPTATSASVVAAINDAVRDGMDVINLSLGGKAMDPGIDPEQQAIQLAVAAGTVVVVSSGNDGPGPGTVNSPGTSPEAITVGAASNGRILGPGIELSASEPLPQWLRAVPYLLGTATSIPSAIGPFPIVSVQSVFQNGSMGGSEASELACSPFADGALDGYIALVRRGSCRFQDKADNVFAAGASALVVYDNLDGGPVQMLFDAGGPGGPAVSVGRASGEAIRDFLNDGIAIDATLAPDSQLMRFPAEPDVLSAFSSWGPNVDRTIKPDLSAPGNGIYTASHIGDTFQSNVSGTSFSCPVVAGAAALLRQHRPGWSVKAIKSALVSTAVKTVSWDGNPARVIQTGNGRLDIGGAGSARAMVDPVSLSFGIVENSSADAGSVKSRRLQITNLSSNQIRFSLRLQEIYSIASVSLQLSRAEIVLGPSETGTVDVEAFYSNPLRQPGVFEGYLIVTDQSGGSTLTVPVWGGVEVEDPTRVLRVSKWYAADFMTLEAALKAARPGNVIEIIDSAVYPSQPSIQFNEEGLPLNGLTIRAKGDEHPVLDGTGFATDSPVLAFQNLKGVTVEGLRVRGGLQGISFQSTTGKIVNNLIESTPSSSSGYGILGSSADLHIFGNTVYGTGGGAIALFTSNALIQNNKIGGMSIGEANQGNGIYASAGSRLAIFDNRLTQNGVSGSGQGIRLTDAEALIKGNVVEKTFGALGDGILSRGGMGDVWLVDNLIKDNQRNGISLASGARGFLLRNTAKQNLESGILVTSGSTMDGQGLRLLANGIGLSVTDSVAALHSSAVAFSDSVGIESDASDLEVTNTSIIKNGSAGILAKRGQDQSVSNSILFQNKGADQSGLAPFNLFSNLIGDGSFSGVNQNFSADPLLADPSSYDFSLQAGSPAIDRGNNTKVARSTDLNSHYRWVDGTGNGEARVDLGAVEFGSKYTAPLILPFISAKPGEFVGLAVTNAGVSLEEEGRSASSGSSGGGTDLSLLTIVAYDQSGHQLGTQSLTVPPGTQKSVLVGELFSFSGNGWIEILSQGPGVVSFSLLGEQRYAFLDGAPLTSAQGDTLVFPEVRAQTGENTTFYVVNPWPVQITAQLRYVSPNGSVQTVYRTISSHGLLKADFQELFGKGSDGGFVIVTSAEKVPLAGIELFGSSKALAGLAALDANSATSQLSGAQLASGGGFQTIVNVINLAATTEQVILEAVDDSGTVVASLIHDLPPQGQLRGKARDLFSFHVPTFVGWLRIRSQFGLLLGSVAFQDIQGQMSAALPFQDQGAREFVFSHVAQDHTIFTGITLLNANTDNALVSLEVFDPDGDLSGRTLVNIPGFSKRALLLSEWIPGIPFQMGGFVRVRSNQRIMGFELFGSGTFLAAVPRQVVVH